MQVAWPIPTSYKPTMKGDYDSIAARYYVHVRLYMDMVIRIVAIQMGQGQQTGGQKNDEQIAARNAAGAPNACVRTPMPPMLLGSAPNLRLTLPFLWPKACGIAQRNGGQ